jgi:OmcA/MtrC family decaheme c-type cytochrome
MRHPPQPRGGQRHNTLDHHADPTHPFRDIRNGLYIVRLLQDSTREPGGNAAVSAFPRLSPVLANHYEGRWEQAGFSNDTVFSRRHLFEGTLQPHNCMFKEETVRKLTMSLGILALIVPLLFLGCSGDDGAPGQAGLDGTNGLDGQDGQDLTAAATPESCSVCHVDVKGIHAATGVASATGGTPALDNGNLVITFSATLDGAASSAFTLYRGYVVWDNTAKATGTLPRVSSNQRDTLYSAADNGAVTTNVGLGFSVAAGTYTVTVPAAYVIDNSTYMFVLKATGAANRPASFTTWQAGAPFRDLVSDTGCASCHGPYPAWQSASQKAEPFQHYAVGGSKCTYCHSNYNRNVNIISGDPAGTLVDTGALLNGTNLVEYVHGIHNSHNMPSGIYFRSTSSGPERWYSVGYPSDMRNCSKCHTTSAQLAAAVTAPVSRALCFSCHQSWDGFVHGHDAADGSYKAGDKIFAASNAHRTIALDKNCMDCHSGVTGIDDAGDFHSDFQSTDAHYDSFYGGKDISFENPDQIQFKIDSVTKTGDNVAFTWSATKGGVAVNPCNTNLDSGPVFNYTGNNLGAYLAYAKGDDWVNDGVSTTPGQPEGAKNLFTSLSTTCAGNVATTTGLNISTAAAARSATKVLVAIGGKAKTKHAATGNAYFVRVPSPTYAFKMADGSAATARRKIVDNAKCTGCHAGTMYQHGGDRIDEVQMCVVCHNPSSNDKNNRLTRYQIVNAAGEVDTTKTYDGKTGESYDLRYLLHAIHGVNKENNTLVIYRSRGVYAFATADAALPTGWPDDGQTIYGSTNGSKIGHNWTVIHYPKAVNDCEACHFPGTYEAPDQTKAVGLTVDAGTAWADQSDDLVIGPTAAACTACHSTAPVRSHAQTFGYKAVTDKDAMVQLSAP